MSIPPYETVHLGDARDPYEFVVYVSHTRLPSPSRAAVESDAEWDEPSAEPIVVSNDDDALYDDKDALSLIHI